MSKMIKAPTRLKKNLPCPQDITWDSQFSPLKLLFHYNDPARAGRILIVEDGDRRIVPETPETFASFIDLIAGGSCCGPKVGTPFSPATKIRLPWSGALAFLRRADWRTIPVEQRVRIWFDGHDGKEWLISGWQALDAGLIRLDTTYDPLSEEEALSFLPDRHPTKSEIAAAVMTQFRGDIAGLEETAASHDLLSSIDAWAAPALGTMKLQPGRTYKINLFRLYKRAYELMAYDYSSVDPTEIGFIDLAGQQFQLEAYHDKETFDRACLEADPRQST
jgi:hypothetical protein